MARDSVRGSAVWACLIVCVCAASLAGGTVVAPAVRALELPLGVASLSADSPLLAPILDGATTTGPGPVIHDQSGKTLSIGKTLVTWRDASDGATVSKYVYLYPYGWQVLGTTTNLRVFEHNGARHVLYDSHNRVHVIYNDGVNVWYRLAVRAGGRLVWQDPVRVNTDATAISWSTYGTRGETFVLRQDPAGNVLVQCVWSSVGPTNRAILTRRLSVDPAGGVTAGEIVNTGLTGSFPCIAADSAGTLHLAVELYSAMTYMSSADGQAWGNYKSWLASASTCTAFRFPNLVIDSHDRLHLLWQAEGYQGKSGSAMWWVGLYTIYNPQAAAWSVPVNILSGIPGWQMPTGSQDILFAYPNMLIDEQDNLHVAWHGTARSLVYAQDDIYYMKKAYNAATDSWSAWTGYTALHKRIFSGTTDGEDYNYSWVPSLAYKPGTTDLFAVFMVGAGDDEVEDPTVNLTDAGLKRYVSGAWQSSYENVVRTDGMRSWYANVAPRTMVDSNGRTWLDMIWVDGTDEDYNIMFRRIDLGGGLMGDATGDGYVNVGDLQWLVTCWGTQKDDGAYTASVDFNNDSHVNVGDLQLLVANWGATGQ